MGADVSGRSAGAVPDASGRYPQVPWPGAWRLLAAAVARIAALRAEDLDHQLLTQLAVLVRSGVPGATSAGITLGSPAHPTQLGSDSAEAQEFDGRQLQSGEGPCWDAHTSDAVVLSCDVSQDDRWPRLARSSASGAVRCVLAVPLRAAGTPLGVLSVNSSTPAALGAGCRTMAELLAGAVAAVLRCAAERRAMRSLVTNLERALVSRAVIDQAKGMVMARMGLPAEEAFAWMVRRSNQRNVKLRDVARLLVDGGFDEVSTAG